MNRNWTNPSELFTVTPDEEGLRLDVFCAARLREFSRSQIQKLIRAGSVFVGDQPRPASHHLRSGERVRIDVPTAAPGPGEPVGEEIPLRVVYEDDDLVVINKQAGIVVHPAAGHRSGTAVNALLGKGVSLSSLGGPERPGVVHRLDKDTSGLLVLAKTDAAYRGLSEQIKSREVQKSYHAIVWGHLGRPTLKIDAPIARHPVHRQKMAVATRGGREAISKVFVVDTFEHFDYIRVDIFTGRTHQIRVHLSHISHPILGDPVYGGRRLAGVASDSEIRSRIGGLLKLMQRQALHASWITFTHPLTGRKLAFKTALPADMRAALEVLYREDKS